ncbi:hypothetical protein AB6A40_001272 [Gnathostoma spinigerum]|uniref:Uncharacterized protein n=1 Tax=Gnathostoma spinigerum TaxID=75299 RepID=A0ABD6ECL8_9BILA
MHCQKIPSISFGNVDFATLWNSLIDCRTFEELKHHMMGQSQSYDLASASTTTPPEDQEHAAGEDSSTRCVKMTHQDEQTNETQTLDRAKSPQDLPLETHSEEVKAAAADA